MLLNATTQIVIQQYRVVTQPAQYWVVPSPLENATYVVVVPPPSPRQCVVPSAVDEVVAIQFVAQMILNAIRCVPEMQQDSFSASVLQVVST